MDDKYKRDAVFVVDDLETLRILTDPLRMQILEMLDSEPQTVNQVAEKIGLTSSRLYYHFNLLEEYGLIQVVETRAVNNMIEKLYWVVAEDIDIDKSLLEFSPQKVQEGLFSVISSSLDSTRSEMLRSLQARRHNLDHGAKPNPRDLVIQKTRKRLTDEVYQDFVKRVRQLLKDFANLPEAREEGEDVNFFSLACFLYPNFYFENEQNKDQEKTEGNELNAAEK